MKRIFIQSEGHRLGPCTVPEIKSLLAGKWIVPNSLGQYEGDSVWRPLKSFPELSEETPTEGEEQLMSAAARPARQAVRFGARGVALGVATLAIGIVLLIQFWPETQPSGESPGLRKPGGAARVSKSAVERVSGLERAEGSTHGRPGGTGEPPHHVATGTTATGGAAAPPGSPTVASVPVRAGPRLQMTSADPAANTPFAVYDRELIDRVRQRWTTLLEGQEVGRGMVGPVVIEFAQNSRGQVWELRVVQDEAGGALAQLCQRAVLESAPFPPWPKALEQAVPQSRRTVRFTFSF